MAVVQNVVLILPLLFGVAMSSFWSIPSFTDISDFGGGGGGWVGDPPEENNKVASQLQQPQDNDYQTDYKGSWELASQSSGISAMHAVLMPTNKVIMFDATNFGPSKIQLPPGDCRPIPKQPGEVDCWAHSVEFDIYTSLLRPLKVLTNTWCSSGALDVDGTLVQTGGWRDGGQGVRYLESCTTCNWEEHPVALSAQRWYSSQHILPDGRMFVVGGRRQFSYEFVPARGQTNGRGQKFFLPLLKETTDIVENNLYPFVNLNTDGNLFILANNRSILLDYTTNTVIREYPILPGGSRNYPSSAMSALLPIRLRGNMKRVTAEVIVCGGAPSMSSKDAEVGNFLPALTSCGRLDLNKAGAQWRIEYMPTPRVMGDMLLLPNAEVLLINGAKRGSAGWNFATDANLEPLVYKPGNPRGNRFFPMASTTIPRMYHSTSVILPDGKVLVAGSNPNDGYNFTVEFPTELRVEKFWPYYFDPLLAIHRPLLLNVDDGKELKYGNKYQVSVNLVDGDLNIGNCKITMYAPPYTTHGYSQNQRMLILRLGEVELVGFNKYDIRFNAPANSKVAPPGYYLLFVVNRGIPSNGMWVRIQ
ncbi:aldehyde oxidase GLOX1-like [Aristolochia californica]|uniref:aldehyde oxidase GLOX1-like n=1 Tax=Aristolochia californica TaxID=171875 RepID=UPI0035E37FA8